MPAYRPRDPQPVSRPGELALAALGGVLVVLMLAALTGLGAAAAVFGGGWVWPPDTASMIATAGGLLSGHPGDGLPAAAAASVPGPAAVYSGVAIAEIVTVVLGVTVGVVIASYAQPGDTRRGMATRTEAARVLGVRRLRTSRRIIRPDLYGPARGNLTGRGRLTSLASITLWPASPASTTIRGDDRAEPATSSTSDAFDAFDAFDASARWRS